MFERISDYILEHQTTIKKRFQLVLTLFSVFTLLVWILQYGFYTGETVVHIARVELLVALWLYIVSAVFRVYVGLVCRDSRKRIFRIFIPLLFALTFQALWWFNVFGITDPTLMYVIYRDVPIAVFILFEFTTSNFKIYQFKLNPSLVYILSFLALIGIGTILLSLPRATTSPMSFLDTVFTSTSAVCVTGLIVADTAKDFTPFGKGILLMLIQIGGLGVVTFTYFFGYFFQGSTSLRSTLYLKNMVSADNMGSTLRTILRIVLVTLSVEAAGAVFIYFSIDPGLFASEGDRISFSVFHAISAFCNAGFSTLSNGLYDAGFRYNYVFQLVIIVLVVVGGIGFPSISNIGRLLRYRLLQFYAMLFRRDQMAKLPRLLNLNSRLAIISSFILLGAGFFAFAAFESQSVLTEHDSWFGKAITSLFGSMTTRTAGFNTFDLTELTMPTLIVMLALMWIGASPSSTGGGIKTVTFSVAFLNILNIGRGKDRLEISRREISNDTVQKAFSIIILSLMLIAFATTMLMYTDPQIAPHRLIFEVFSAVGTVGLTLDVTPNLSPGGKVVIILCMFIGRVGAITLLTALTRKVVSLRYRYPREELHVG